MHGPPGPWAGGYQFADPAAAAPAPAPEEATTGYPSPAPDIRAEQPTLGAVAGAAGGGNIDVGARFREYLTLADAAHSAGMRPYLPEESKPGALANIFTFGMAGLMERDYRRAYNAKVDEDNQKLRAQAVKDAVDLVGNDVRGATGDLSTQIRLLTLQQQMLNARNTELYRQSTLALRGRGVDVQEGGLDLRRDQAAYNRTTGPPTREEKAAAGDLGYVYVPSPVFPGRYVRVKAADAATEGVGGTPADPSNVAGTGPGGVAGAPAAARDPRKPYTSGDLAQDKANEARGIRTAQEQGKIEALRLQFGVPTLEMIDGMIDATDALPEGQTAQGIIGSYTGATGIYNRARLKMFEGKDSPDVEKIRRLEAGNMLVQQLYRMVAVGVATKDDVRPYEERLGNLVTQSKQEARNKLQQVRDFVSQRYGAAPGAGGGTGAPPPAASTPTSPLGTGTTGTTTPSTGAPRTGDEYLRGLGL